MKINELKNHLELWEKAGADINDRWMTVDRVKLRVITVKLEGHIEWKIIQKRGNIHKPKILWFKDKVVK